MCIVCSTFDPDKPLSPPPNLVPNAAPESLPLFSPGWDVPRDELIAEKGRLFLENARLNSAIGNVLTALRRIDGRPGQDVEAEIALIIEGLERALEGPPR